SFLFFHSDLYHLHLHSFPTRRSSDLKPVLSIQFQYALSISLFSWYARSTIYNFYPLFAFFFHRSAYHKDLCNTGPIFLEPCVHLRPCPNFTHFQPSMPFIRLFMILKFFPINPSIPEEFS